MTDHVSGLPVARSAQELRGLVRAWRAQRPCGRLAFVPTMGALHEGHLRLIDAALDAADGVVVSIYVNPTQFAPGEDFGSYPRTFVADCEAVAGRGAAFVFAPTDAVMYPPGDQTEVQVPELGAGLCGVSRPHFFGGVARVVLKLLNLVQPDVAVFGEKDFQQLQIIRRMVRDLHVPVAILGVPTVREADGLAMSSRNRYLSPSQRAAAPVIHRALSQMAARVGAGERDAGTLLAEARGAIEAAGGRVDYLALVDADDLSPVERVAGPARAAAAVWFGEARLIDNIAIATA